MQSGLTAGAVASREGHVEAVDLLCRAGANMRAADKVFFRSRSGLHTHLLVMLCQLRAQGGWTPLHWAAYFGQLSVMNFLLKLPNISSNARNSVCN